MDILIVNSTNIYTLLLVCRTLDDSLDKMTSKDTITDTDEAFLKRFVIENGNTQQLKHVKVLLSVINMKGNSDKDILEINKLTSRSGVTTHNDNAILNRKFLHLNLKHILDAKLSKDMLDRVVPMSYRYLINGEDDENQAS